MTKLARLRPSNLVIFAVLPFIIYLFTMVPNYRRSIIAIVGIEDNAAVLLRDFVLVALMLGLGCVAAFLRLRGHQTGGRRRAIAWAALAGFVALAWYLALAGNVSALAASVVANILDPVTSDLVMKAVTPRQLTPEGIALVAAWTGWVLRLAAAAGSALAAAVAYDLATGRPSTLGKWAGLLLLGLAGASLLYLLFSAHLGFAAGLFTTIRAGVFAYVLAAVLGLLWATLLRVKARPRTVPIYGGVCAALLAAAVVLFMQPHTTYVLVGSLDKSVAIVKGTPKSLVDTIRFGQFDSTITQEIGLRSTTSPEHALKLLAEGTEVSAAFLPAEAAPADVPELWRTSFLDERFHTPAVALLVAAILLGLLTFSAFQHQRHPLSVSAEFFIDTVRGIPMLVIILFVGLPFAGAVKDTTGGVIDMPNVVRGVIAIALGYSAYLAEIFRAGIDAVPKGQIEAARTLGLSSWQLARLVVFPQALKVVIPPLGNEFIAMLKDTSLLSILSVRDVTQRMREFQSASFLPFAPFNSAAILYVFLTLAAASLIASIERKYDVKHR